MYTLGLATMTESSAVLMKDGYLVAAAEEERFTRIKHDGGFPYNAIQYCMETQGITLGDIEHIAVYWNPYKLGTRIGYMTRTLFTDPVNYLNKVKRAFEVLAGSQGEDSGWGSIFFTKNKLEKHFNHKPKNIYFFDHHLCHMASCFYASNFEDSAILIMDGAGEAACTSWGIGEGKNIKIINEHKLPHSLGHFYSAVTGFLGFKMLDGEYKVMGLSPYGDPSASKWIRENFLISVAPGQYRLNKKVLDYVLALQNKFNGKFRDYFGSPRVNDEENFDDRYKDIAASAQKAFEDVVLDMAQELQRLTGLSNLVIAGGCGLNCTANGKILTTGTYENIYIPPVPHDAGGALGAAMLLYKKITGKRPEPVVHAQYGPEYNDYEISKAISKYENIDFIKLESEDVPLKTAKALSQGKIISWFQGKMEIGPRALGNRSFLADPRNDSIRDSINKKIKKRELFRPFAPSVKEEKANDYFNLSQSSPFMNIIVPVNEDKKNVIPAVTHVDGTARPQTVSSNVNHKYWKLLDCFEKLTGVPVLLNTSFNIQEPIVCNPHDAMLTFTNSEVDALVIGDYWLTRANK